MKKLIRKKNSLRNILLEIICLISILSFLISGCNAHNEKYDNDGISATLLNGEHYSIVGENKKNISYDNSVSFEILIDRGYKIVGAYGDIFEITDNVSFEQTVTFSNLKYKATLRLETARMEESNFVVEVNNEDMGNVHIDSILGTAKEDTYYCDDSIKISAVANLGYGFQCWSVDNFLSNGGKFYSYSNELPDFNFSNFSSLYANFRELSNTGNMIFYEMDGIEIEQDCTAMLEHHPRANTYTAVDIREEGIDCDSRMLVGWETEEGEYVGLGSRVAVSSETATMLYPIWKDYTDTSNFIYEEISTGKGRITKYTGKDIQEVTIPNEINGLEITTIGANAFEESEAHTYYLPDTITTVEDNAFKGCKALKELYMSDNITEIDDKSFTGCENFTTLHVNAVLKPRYTGIDTASYKADVYDRLALNANNRNRKFVVLGGSSVYYAYDIKSTIELFEENDITVDAYNLGHNASYCLAAQFEIANQYLKANDIFLYAPEHYDGVWCANEKLSPLTDKVEMALSDGYLIFRLTEGNWQFFSGLTVSNYSNLFSMFKQFNQDRSEIKAGSYADYWPTYDESKFGPHSTGDSAELPWGRDESFNGKATFNKPETAENALKFICDVLLAKEVIVYMTFPPVNRHALILQYGNEENLKTAAENYTNEIKSFVSGREITVLCTQYDTVYNGSEFVNHDYHLGYPKRDEHTHKIIVELIETLLQKENVER